MSLTSTVVNRERIPALRWLRIIPPRLFNAEVAGAARGLINALGNLGGFCELYMVGVLIAFYSKDAGVYSLAISLTLAALLVMTLPARCDSAKREAL